MRLRGKVDSESSKREGPGSSNRTVLSQSILAAMFSKTERFEEKASEIPPVGAYDVKSSDASYGPTSFDKTRRFHQPESSDSSFADDSLCSAVPQKSLSRPPSTSSKPRLVRGEKKPPVPSASQARISELEKELKKLLAERNSLNKQLFASKQEVSKLEGKVQMSMREKSALQSQVAGLLKENYNLSHGKNILQSKVANSVDARKAVSLQNELQYATQQLQTNQKELSVLNLELDASTRHLQEDLSFTREEKLHLETRVAALECEIHEARESRTTGERELVELKGILAHLEETSSILQESLDHAQQECKDKELQLTEAKKQTVMFAEDKAKLLKELEAEREVLQKQLSDSGHVIAERTQENNGLQQQLKVTAEVSEELRDEKERLQKEISLVNAQLGKMSEELKRQQAEQQEALESLTHKCLTFEEELAQEKQISRENQAILRSQLMAMEVSNKEQAKEGQKWVQEYQSVTSQLREQEAENAALKSQAERMKREHQQGEELLKRNLQQVLGIAEELKTKESSQASDAEQWHRKALDFQKQLETASAKIEEEREKASSLEKKLEMAAETVVEGRIAFMKQEMSRRLVETQKKLSMHEVQNERMQHDLQSRIAELEEQLRRLHEEKDQLQRAYSELQEKYRPFQDQIDGLEDLNKLLQSQTAHAQLEAQSLSEQYAKLLGHQNHKQKIQHIKKLKDENAVLKQEVTVLRADISRHKKTIKKLEDEGCQKSTHGYETKPLLPKN